MPAATAGAASRIVGLGDYRWSAPDVTVDLGESVTFVWAGPDTRHSVSPLDLAARAAGLPDSDPGPVVGPHRVGDRFAIRFTQPGTYVLGCKLHNVVRGTVTVTDVPAADPDAPSADPEPVLHPDRRPPRLSGLRVTRTRLRFALDEAAQVTADLVRLRGRGEVLLRTRTLRAHVGDNDVALLRPRARGRYRLVLRAVDASGNAAQAASASFAARMPERSAPSM